MAKLVPYRTGWCLESRSCLVPQKHQTGLPVGLTRKLGSGELQGKPKRALKSSLIFDLTASRKRAVGHHSTSQHLIESHRHQSIAMQIQQTKLFMSWLLGSELSMAITMRWGRSSRVSVLGPIEVLCI